MLKSNIVTFGAFIEGKLHGNTEVDLLKWMFLSDRNESDIFGFSVKFPIEIIPTLVSGN